MKDASLSYLKYLAKDEVDVGKLKSCFVATVLHGEIYSASQAKKKSLHANLVEMLRTLDVPPSQMRRIPNRRVISTKSNLKGAVLREITATLGIDYSQFELKERPVIDRLVKFRNTIAHGGGNPVEKDDYNVLHTEIIILMDKYRDLIQDAADNDRHFR